jgi:hypothetical protein
MPLLYRFSVFCELRVSFTADLFKRLDKTIHHLVPLLWSRTVMSQDTCLLPADRSRKRRLTMPSTPTEAVLDVNIIIAAVFADHVKHAAARRFVEGLDRFHTTPMTQGGFLRFASQQDYFDSFDCGAGVGSTGRSW